MKKPVHPYPHGLQTAWGTVSALLITILASSVDAGPVGGAPPILLNAINPTTPAGADGSLLRIQSSPDALPGAVYLWQGRDQLNPASPWQTVEPVLAESNVVSFESSLPAAGTTFYRLLLPEPQLFRVEPSVGPASGGTTIFVVGQCLGTNGQARIGGLVLTPNVLQPGTTYSLDLPPLAGGVYDLEWLEGGQIVARRDKVYSVIVPPGITQRLLEPPVEPPGSPSSSLMKAKEKANRTKCANNLRPAGGGDCDDGPGLGGGGSGDCDDRLMVHSGELQLEAEDLFIPGRGLDFIWSRTYRSRTGSATPMGANWDHSYNIRITGWDDASGQFDLWDGTGRNDRFFRGTNGVYSRDEFFCEALISNSIFTVTFPDTGKWEFNPFDGSASAGKISRRVDRNGNAMSFTYDGVGLLTEIVDTLGRTNRVAYNANGLIDSVTDFTGRAVRYSYQGQGSSLDLATVTTPPVTGTPNGNDFPAGKTTTYTYSSKFADERLNHNLLSIIDPKGQEWLQVRYRTNQDSASLNFDTVGLVQRGPYRVKLSRFAQTPSPANQFATVKCIVNDGVGNVSECFFDSLNRCVRELDYSGRANPDLPTTETANRPAGKLRAEDPDFFESRWTWNSDSLCTRYVTPRASTRQMIYERDFDGNTDPHRKGDLRVLRELACCLGADTDGDGVPDLTERTMRFDYDPRFGSPTIQGRAGRGRKNRTFEDQTDSDLARKGWDGTIKGNALYRGPRQTVSLDGTYDPKNRKSWDGTIKGNVFVGEFAMRAVDARGVVTTASYDSQGNCIRIAHQGRLLDGSDSPVEEFAFNAYGQLTTITNAPDGNGSRRVDTWGYYASGPQTGFLQSWTVDAAGLGLTTSYEYDPRGNVTRCIDPRGFDSLATYNALDQVTTRTTPSTSFGSLVRYATTFTYDANDNLVQTDLENRDETGALDPANPAWTSSAEYDLLNRRTLQAHELTHVLQQRSRTNRFAYDGNDNLVLEQFPEAVSGADPSNVVAHEYDERNLLFRSTAAPGTGLSATNQFDYDGNGNCVRVREIDAFTIKQGIRTYDGFDRCVGVTDAMGNVDTWVLDRNDNLILDRTLGEFDDVAGSTGNSPLSETRYDYDSLDRRLHTRASIFDVFTGLSIGDGEATTTFTYAPNGLLLSEMDDNGNLTRYTYDSAHRLGSVNDPRTNIWVYQRDPAGNVTATSSIERSDLSPLEQTFTTVFAYDGLNRCVSSSNNVGNVTQFSYNSRGDCVSEIDPRGNETVRVFDGLDRCLQTICYEGTSRTVTLNTTHVEYQNDRCVSSTDGNGNITSFAYDSLDRLVATTNADQTVESLVWSPRSNLSSRTDPNGTVVTYAHDLLDRCVRKDITVAPGVAATTTFEEFSYDGLSRLRHATNNTSMNDFGYDSLGNLVSAYQDGLAVLRTFDGMGNCLGMTYPGGRVVVHTYGADNLLTGISTAPIAGGALTSLASFAHDGPDRLSGITRANGINTRINWNGTQQTPNSQGDFGWRQISRIRHALAGGTSILDEHTFQQDRNQNTTARIRTPGTVVPGETVTLSYDGLDRLATATVLRGGIPARDTGYQLDANGNRVRVTVNGAPGDYTMSPALPEPADFQMNQYTTTPFGVQQHDRNGNLLLVDSGSGPTYYHFDYANRLVSVERTVGPALIPVASYAYDALGRRVSRTVYPPAPEAPLTTQFVQGGNDCDDDDIIEERERGVVTFYAVWPHMHQLATHARISAAGEILYTHTDDLDNVLALTDAGGSVVERYDYDDYGSPGFLDAKGAPLIGTDGFPVNYSPAGLEYLFHGMFWDDETGLYFGHSQGSNVGPLRWMAPEAIRNRTYNPRTGQYLCPSGLCADRQSPRAFEGNNPWSASAQAKQKAWLCSNFRIERRAFGGGGGDGRLATAAAYGAKTGSSGRTKRTMISGGGESGGLAPAVYKATQGKTGKANNGRLAAGGVSSYFNPKEYTISKVTVRGWNPEKKEEIVGMMEEGGRHTPFHNRRATDVTGEIDLPAGRARIIMDRDTGRSKGFGQAGLIWSPRSNVALDDSGGAGTAGSHWEN